MAQGRVDQITVARALTDHDQRLQRLERNPQAVGGAGLPPWAEWEDLFAFGLISDAGTPPGSSVSWAGMMVQTVDGNSWFPANDPDASDPLVDGTVLAGVRAFFTDAGTPVTSEPTALLVPVGLDQVSPRSTGGFHPAYFGVNPSERRNVIIGYGTIAQESVTAGPRFGFKVTLDGHCLVDNTPDPFCPSGFESFSYYIRIPNAAAGDPGYPFAIADGDSIEYQLIYPLVTTE